MDPALHHNILEWQNLHYTVPVEESSPFNLIRKRTKTSLEVLNNVSGFIQSGHLVAILGPSGSGKTSLLAAVSKRLRGCVEGQIILNGTEADRESMTQLTSYLPQNDISAANLTASDHLIFMCHFKMSKRTPHSEKIRIVRNLLKTVGLHRESDTLISNLSGGERRRLGVAEELIRNPLFLFCDEPTTGLDSFNAFSVIKTLRDLTRDSDSKPIDNDIEMHILSDEKDHFNGELNRLQKGVLCSIHQPSSQVFELFTHVILLSGGKVIYQGSSNGAYLYFSKLGIHCPKNCNPADFYIKIISEEMTSKALCDNIEDDFAPKLNYAYGMCYKSLSIRSALYMQGSQDKIPWIYQVFYLLRRSTKNVRSAFYEDFFRTIFLLVTSVTLGLVYMNTKAYSQSSIQNIQGLMFMFCCEVIFTSTYSIIHEFPASLPIIRREVGENTYSLSSYYIAQLLRRIPQAIFSSFLFLGVTVAISNVISSFLLYLRMGLVLAMASLTAASYGLFLSSLLESNRMSTEIAAPFDMLFLLFGGYYLNANSIPTLKYVSLFYYCYEALSFEYWHDVQTIHCSVKNSNCFQNGVEVLQEFSLGYQPETIVVDYIGLIVICLVMNILAFIFVSRYVKKVGYY